MVTAIIGAGPAGMACAYTLAMRGKPAVLFERDEEPGGLCRTLNFNGYLFDIGGHRFLTKSEEIKDLWRDIMGDDMLHVKRLSRIYYRKKYFNYPLTFLNTFSNLGALESFLCVASYFRCKLFRPGDDNTFEGWIINHFGKRLYKIFFDTYTTKVWAMACKDISADWAAQRIRGLSLRVAVQNALMRGRAATPKTLTDEFLYPRTGPGEFYKRLGQKIVDAGGRCEYGKSVIGVRHEANKVTAIQIQDRHTGKVEETSVDTVFSTTPLTLLIKSLIPQPPEEILFACKKLSFRSYLVVNIILDQENIFPDQWIYVHEPEVKLGRIQNYKNWSPAMTIDSKKTSLGLEYFCTEGDEFWQMNDLDLINFALGELEKIKIASRNHFINGFVVRRSNVYPIYTLDYRENVEKIKKYLDGFSNLQTFGRQGLFRYDNSDHALLTGIYAARNFLGEGPHDVWSINADDQYLES